MKKLISSKYKYLIFLIVPIAFVIYFYPAKKIILNCKMNTDNLFLNFYDKEDSEVLYKAHNIQRVPEGGIKSDQNYGNENYIVMDWQIYNYSIKYNIFGNPISLYNHNVYENNNYTDIYFDDIWIEATGKLETFGNDIYDDELIKRDIVISIVRETLDLVVATYPSDEFGLKLHTNYNCKLVENLI